MKIYLFLNDKLLNFSLPQDILGSFSFDEYEDENTKLINIEARDNKWYLYSTEDVTIIENGNHIIEKEISNNQFYSLKRGDNTYLIYTSDIKSNKFDFYNYSDKLNIIIGNSKDCNLKYTVGNYNNYIAKIYFKENKYILNINKIVVYINDKVLKSENYILKYGDVITIYSLKIIFFKDLIVINNPMLINYLSGNNGLTIKQFESEELENIDIKDKDLYNKNDYFSKSPRIRRIIEEKNVQLSSSPGSAKESELPFILTIGPMITMALISVVMFGSSISDIFNKKTTIKQQLPSLISAGAMVLSMLLWPLIIRWYTKKINKKKRREIISKYTKYLNDKRKDLEEEYKLQKEIILENLIDCKDCLNIIQRKGYNFWDKRIDQDDFLFVRIGIGETLLKLKIEYPKEGFTIEEDELKKKADALVEEFKYIKDVPVGYSFYENVLTAIMGNAKKSYGFIQNVILQLITFYSYEDVKIVIFTDNRKLNNWNYIKYLSHNFNNDRTFRFFSSDLDSSKYVSDYLINELNYRLNNKQDYPKPHYLIITDNYEIIKNYEFFKIMTENDNNLGFSCIILENRLSKLPSKCNNFITLGIDKQCGILKNSYEKQEQIYFNEEIDYDIDMLNIAKIVSNIPIEFESGVNKLPDTISFLEMEHVGKVEQLNVLNRWNMSDSTSSLRAEIGLDEQENLMYLDLHEKAHGPHGLIAGTTGSGKSEFIITYILSMCINYSPDDVTFVIIDYKGGGLALAFENKVTGVTLPHLAGTITNLDKAEMDRTLVSIDSEVKRRQQLFNIARDNLGESTMDIYKYQRFYHDGKLKESISHLFIICDEFAELKTQQPDFMDNLISVARIGRSLGVHLILATQKPSGVVNDQIWSNSRFKVCLKVQDEADSREMLKKSDAAYIKQVGRFYLQVGYDEYYALGQSAWCGAKYYPSDKIIKQVDKSINIINDCGLFIKSIQASNGNKKNAQGEQLSAILNDIIIAAKRVNKFAKKLWLESIPSTILVDDLYKKYKVDSNNICAIIGEYDAPEKQEQGIVLYDYLEDGNTVIYGIDGSERELLLSSIIYSTVINYSSSLINFYAIDYGSEFLNKYLSINHFGGVVTASEEEEFNNLFKLINNEIKRRKKILSNLGIDYKAYKQKDNMPIMIIILNNYDSIYENNQNLYDDLPDLVRDSKRFGIIFIFTCSAINSIHSKILAGCENYYSYKLKDTSDYSSVFGVGNKIVPRDIFGRGLLNIDGIHEFQTAKILLNEDKLNEFISNLSLKINKNNKKARSIPLLPEIVRFNHINQDVYNLSDVPIGISKTDLDITRYDFRNSIASIISSNKLNNTLYFVKSLLYVLKNIKSINLFIFDPMKLLNVDINYFNNYFTKDLDKVLDKINENISNLINNKQEINGVIVIYGVNKFINIIDKDKMDLLSENLKKYEKISLIMVDDYNKFKNITFDTWFNNIVNLNDGIWIGKGIVDQSLFHLSSINKDMTIELKNNMGYLISEGSVTMCKFIDLFTRDDEDGK